MLLELDRWKIRLQVDGKTVTIRGEALLPSPGEPDFVCGRNAVQWWDPPNEKEVIDEVMRKKIFDLAREELAKRKMTLEVE